MAKCMDLTKVPTGYRRCPLDLNHSGMHAVDFDTKVLSEANVEWISQLLDEPFTIGAAKLAYLIAMNPDPEED